ncbi:MAG: redoxin domain-containing protein [Dehalococcoidia bacterium]|nr:redoxin domain-containing protein [Dehalococcoidia bacterium]
MAEGEPQTGPKFCRQCGGVVPEGTPICPRCGQKWYMDRVEQQGADLWQKILEKRAAAGLGEAAQAQEQKQYRCPNCMAVLQGPSPTCPHCGKSTAKARIVPPGQEDEASIEKTAEELNLPPAAKGLAAIKGASRREERKGSRRRLKTLDIIIIVVIVIILAGAGFMLARQYGILPSTLTFFNPPEQQQAPPEQTTTAEEVSNIAISDITSDGATIAWTTAEPAWGKVIYGKTESYGDAAAAIVQGSAQKVTLSGLEPSTTYHFAVVVTDGKGKELHSSNDHLFETVQRVNTIPPVVIGFKVLPTDGSAIISWSTDTPSSSQVLYGPDTSCSSTTVEDTMMVTEHIVRIIGLEANTSYYYRIRSVDADGNVATMDPPNTFTTLVTVPTGPRIGDRAPDFTLPIFGTQKTISLRDYRGQKVLLTFWAVYCPECDRELSLLQSIQDKNIPGVNVIAVFMESKLDDIDKTIATYKSERGELTVPVVVDMYKTTAHSYNVEKVPYTVFIDSDMIIRDIEPGNFNLEQVERTLNTL